MGRLSDRAIKLIEGKNFADVATLMPDGSPQISTTWIDHEKDIILINSTEKRIKTKNLKRDPRVAISVYELANPYNAVWIKGKVIEITKVGAEEHIDKLARKYLGKDKYPEEWKDATGKRVIIRIEPIRDTGYK